MYDILLTDAMVIPVDPEHHIWEKGYIAITGDRIAALGPMEELGGELPQARQHISLKGHALLPGLVDGHGQCGRRTGSGRTAQVRHYHSGEHAGHQKVY